jgi:mono/diheme cytochrome c family protein
MRLQASFASVLSAVLLACAGTETAELRTHDPHVPVPSITPPPDGRPVVTASTPPPAISGGTLLVSADGELAIASDPDRDRISIVELQTRTVRHVELEPGSEPGRAVEDATGRVHVALRRAGEVATIDLANASMLARTPVCAAPRGLAFDAAADEVLVACASGELARMPSTGGNARTVAQLGSDLRDVALFGGELLLTRFHRAEVVRLDATGAQQAANRPPPARALFGEPSTSALIADTLSPQLAYRLDGRGSSLLLLAQLERDGEIDLARDDANTPQTPASSISPYGSDGGSCGGVVQTMLANVTPDGTIADARRIPGVLIVDAAQAHAGGPIAVAQAGALDSVAFVRASPTPFTSVQTSEVLLFAQGLANATAGLRSEQDCLPSDEQYDVQGQVTAVAFAPDGDIIAQSREPAFLQIIDRTSPLGGAHIPLGGDDVEDTGHELFHRNAGNGIACASCHAEGGDDGHTWRFSGMGPRRTQSLHVGLAGSAPFHWAGDERDFNALIEDVMIGRMGGARQSPERIAALEQWLYSLPAPPPPRAAADEAAQRGKLLFEGAAECGTCHSGVRLSSNETKAVGKGEALQVPSLVAIAYRTPLMHDGCAADLRARFDPKCGGGDQHGKTSQLNPTQLDDLIAYLETL